MLKNQSKGCTAIINGKIVASDQILEHKVLLIEDAKIKAISDEGEIADQGVETIDAKGGFVSPGLVDLHHHGALRHTFNEPDDEAYKTILDLDLRMGVTTVFPTLLAVPIPDLCNALEFIHGWRASQTPCRTQISGAYLESPYIAPAQHGAISASFLRHPDDGSISQILEHHADIRVFMLAPELPGAVDAVKEICRNGIVAAMGHSMAVEEEVDACIHAGASHVTHLWSAMSSVTRRGPWRYPGLLETALERDALTAEIIADNCHLPKTLMRMAVKCKGGGKLCAVSDALNGAGLPEGAHYFAGDMEYEVRDGVGMVLDHSCFAGSTTLLGQEVPILINVVGLSIPEAFQMVTAVPAKIGGVGDSIGSLLPGYDADVVIWNDDFTVRNVLIKGKKGF